MNEQGFDLVILGAGPGGYPAAIRAAQLGLKVALIEKYKLGGTCLHWGCIPTKVILETAEVYTLANQGTDFGITTGQVAIDYAQVGKRREKVVSQHTGGIEWLMKKNGVTVVYGEGKLTSPTSVSVQLADAKGTTQLTGKDLIIATGSVAKSLPGIQIDGDRVISSDHAVVLPSMPKSVIIIGAGAIGSEFASAWKDMGVEVTLVEVLPRVLPLEDREVGAEIARLFTRRGIRVMAGTRVLLDSLKTFPDHVEIDVEREGARERLSAERLLVATGRAAVTQGIGLESLGVKMERGFIQVDGQGRTNIPHLYAIGDVVGGLMLAHKAHHEGFIAVEAILGRSPQPLDSTRIPRCTYCHPQVASIGMGEDEAKEKGHRVKVGKFPMSANSMATILGERVGFAKIVADEDSMEILGVHLVGPRVTELIASPALARLLEATPEEIALNVHPHPTLSEALGQAAEDITYGQSIDFWHEPAR